jgi:N-terminal domain of NWD NACHT-NTPase
MAEPGAEDGAGIRPTARKLANWFSSHLSMKAISASRAHSRSHTPTGENRNEIGERLQSSSGLGTADATGTRQTQADNRLSSHPSDILVAGGQALSDVGRASEPPREMSSEVGSVTSSISELWNQAFEELRTKEQALIRGYEAVLSKDLAATAGSAMILSNSKSGRRGQMEAILKAKIAEINRNSWKLKFSGKEVPVKDLMEPVAGVIGWANEYINSALSANPYASIAWSGVSLLLPVSL